MGKKEVKPKPLNCLKLSQEWETAIINGLHVHRIRYGEDKEYTNIPETCDVCNVPVYYFHRFGCPRETAVCNNGCSSMVLCTCEAYEE